MPYFSQANFAVLWASPRRTAAEKQDFSSIQQQMLPEGWLGRSRSP